MNLSVELSFVVIVTRHGHMDSSYLILRVRAWLEVGSVFLSGLLGLLNGQLLSLHLLIAVLRFLLALCSTSGASTDREVHELPLLLHA